MERKRLCEEGEKGLGSGSGLGFWGWERDGFLESLEEEEEKRVEVFCPEVEAMGERGRRRD